jgi:hypothetical protein
MGSPHPGALPAIDGVDPAMHCNPSGRLRQGPPVDPASAVPLGQISVKE